MTSMNSTEESINDDGLRHRHHDNEEREEEDASKTTAHQGSMAAFDDVFFKPEETDPRVIKISSNDELKPPQGYPERWCACCGFQYDENKLKDIVDVSEEDKNIEDMSQILKDVRRTMWNWSFSREDRQKKQAGLCRVLVKAFAQNRGTKHYFQGCNEISAILLFALGETQAVKVLDWLMNHTLTRWFELSLPPLVELMAHVMPLLDIADEELYHHISMCIGNGEQPTFALSWLMTWLSHNTDDVQAIYKAFDVLFDAREGDAVSIIYIATQIIVMCKEDAMTRSEEFIHEFFTKLLPPIVTRDRANLMLAAEADENKSKGYLPPLAKGSVKMIIIEDVIDGAKKMMKKIDWDELKKHKEQLEKSQEEVESRRVYRANVTHDDQQNQTVDESTKNMKISTCTTPSFQIIVGGILFASVAGVWYFMSH